MLVSQDLYLDMTRFGDEFFQVHLSVAERSFRLRASLPHQLIQLVATVDDPNTSATTAAHCLEHHRIAQLISNQPCIAGVLNRPFGAGHYRYVGLHHGGTRLCLIAHASDDARRRANKVYLAGLTNLRKARHLGQIAVARMYRFSPGDDCCAYQVGHIQIAF